MAPRPLVFRTLGSLSGLCASVVPHVTKEGWWEGQGCCDLDRQALLWTPAAEVSYVSTHHCQIQVTSYSTACSHSPRGLCRG